MGLILRQSFKSSIGFYLGIVLGAINTLFISTKFLSTDQLAISRLITENSIILASFCHLGAPYIADRYFSYFKENENDKNGFHLLLIILPVLGFLVLLCLYLIFKDDFESIYAEKSPSLIKYLWLTLPNTFFWSYVSIFEAVSRFNGRTAVPTMIRESYFRFFNIVLILLLGFGWIEFYSFLLLNALLLLSIVLILVIYVKKNGGFRINLSFLTNKKKELREFLNFGLFIIVGSLGVSLILFLDRNIIAQKLGTEFVAIFVIASYLASVLEIPAKAIKQISTPILAGFIKDNDHLRISDLYRKSANNLMVVGGLMFTLIFVNLNDLFEIMPKSDLYIQGRWVVVIIAFAKWIEMSLGLNSEIIGFSKYFRFNTYLVIVLSIVVVVLNYLLIPILGITGSALATASVTLLATSIRFLFVYSKYKINPFKAKELIILVLMLGSIALAVISEGYLKSDLWINLLLIFTRSILIVGIFAFFIITFNISEDLVNVYKQVKSKISKYSY